MTHRSRMKITVCMNYARQYHLPIRRYRRQDEIGTPFCVTYDFESETDGAVTVRDRDTMEQERVKIEDLKAYFEKKFEY